MEGPEDQQQQECSASEGTLQGLRNVGLQQGSAPKMHGIPQFQYYQCQQMAAQNDTPAQQLNLQGTDPVVPFPTGGQMGYPNNLRTNPPSVRDTPASQYVLIDQMQPHQHPDGGLAMQDFYQQQNIQFAQIEDGAYQRSKSSPQISSALQKVAQHKVSLQHQSKSSKRSSPSLQSLKRNNACDSQDYSRGGFPFRNQKQDTLLPDVPQAQDHPHPKPILQRDSQRSSQKTPSLQDADSSAAKPIQLPDPQRQIPSSPLHPIDQRKNDARPQPFLHRNTQMLFDPSLKIDRKSDDKKSSLTPQHFQNNTKSASVSQQCSPDFQQISSQRNPQVQPYFRSPQLFVYQNRKIPPPLDFQKKNPRQDYLNNRFRQSQPTYSNPIPSVIVQSPQPPSFQQQQSMSPFPQQNNSQQESRAPYTRCFPQHQNLYTYPLPGNPVVGPPQSPTPRNEDQFAHYDTACQIPHSHTDPRMQLAYVTMNLSRSDLTDDERARLSSIKNDLELLIQRARLDAVSNINYFQVRPVSQNLQTLPPDSQGPGSLRVCGNVVHSSQNQQLLKQSHQQKHSHAGQDDTYFAVPHDKFQQHSGDPFQIQHSRASPAYSQVPKININTQTRSPISNPHIPQQNLAFQQQPQTPTTTPCGPLSSPDKDFPNMKVPIKQHGRVILEPPIPSPQKQLREPSQQNYARMETASRVSVTNPAVSSILAPMPQQHQHTQEHHVAQPAFPATQPQGTKNFPCWSSLDALSASPSWQYSQQQYLAGANNQYLKQVSQSTQWQQQDHQQVQTSQNIQESDDASFFYTPQATLKNVNHQPHQRYSSCQQQLDFRNGSFAGMDSSVGIPILDAQKWYPRDNQALQNIQYDPSSLQRLEFASPSYYPKYRTSYVQSSAEQQQRRFSTQELKGGASTVPSPESATSFNLTRRRRSNAQKPVQKKQVKRRVRTQATPAQDSGGVLFDRKQPSDEDSAPVDLGSSQLAPSPVVDITASTDANFSQFVTYPSPNFAIPPPQSVPLTQFHLDYPADFAESSDDNLVSSEQPGSQKASLPENGTLGVAEADRSLEAFPYGENIGTLDSVIRLPTKDQQEGIRAAHGDQRRLSAINTDAMSPTAEMLRLTRNFYPLPAFSYGARSSENAGECLSSMAPVERNSEKVSIASEDENRDEVVFSGSSIAALERQRQEQLKDLLFEVEPSARLSHQAETHLLRFLDSILTEVTRGACKIAKHRGAKSLAPKDMQLEFERNWNLHIPDVRGAPRVVRREVPSALHLARLSAVRRSRCT